MKIALLNDTHFGVRNDSTAFADYQLKFYKNIFFPYLKEHNIKTLIHLGDVVDRRKFINFQTAETFRKEFFEILWKEKIDTHIILGNHDTYYKNTNSINAIKVLYTTFDGVHEPFIYEHAQEVEIGGLKMLFLPWICDDNEKHTMELIKSTDAQVVMGHLEIKGFEMHNGQQNFHGFDKEFFNKFDMVMSGHFHKRSNNNHIYYLGAQYEMTWSDFKDPKGFNVFDTETRELTHIKNPYTIHKKIFYDDTKEDYTNKDITEYDHHLVKLIVVNKSDKKMFETYVEKFYQNSKVHELNIIEDFKEFDTSSVSDNVVDISEDTVTLLNGYIDQIDTPLDKQKLKNFMKSLYNEAGETGGDTV